jgi:hypothetical protein
MKRYYYALSSPYGGHTNIMHVVVFESKKERDQWVDDDDSALQNSRYRTDSRCEFVRDAKEQADNIGCSLVNFLSYQNDMRDGIFD